jgi:hypothetical protein
MTFLKWRKSRLRPVPFFFKLSLCNFLKRGRYIVVTKQLEIMAIGFNTPSKRQAEDLETSKGQNSPQMGIEQMMSVTPLKAETYDRANSLGSMILSPMFATLPPEQKQAMLIDFAYFKSVADNL